MKREVGVDAPDPPRKARFPSSDPAYESISTSSAVELPVAESDKPSWKRRLTSLQIFYFLLVIGQSLLTTESVPLEHIQWAFSFIAYTGNMLDADSRLSDRNTTVRVPVVEFLFVVLVLPTVIRFLKRHTRDPHTQRALSALVRRLTHVQEDSVRRYGNIERNVVLVRPKGAGLAVSSGLIL